MLPKQTDMDSVVRKIHRAVEEKAHLRNTLFVLLGDHGMTEQGNHGGDTPGELASTMIFISPRFKSNSKGLESPLAATENYKYYSTVNQVDLVPTLAGLLGFNTPSRNTGIFITQFIEFFNRTDDAIRVLLQNAKQIMKVFELESHGAVLNTTLCNTDCAGCETENRIACLWEKVTHAEQEFMRSDHASSDALMLSIRTVGNSSPI